jgi:hypothetical protein
MPFVTPWFPEKVSLLTEGKFHIVVFWTMTPCNLLGGRNIFILHSDITQKTSLRSLLVTVFLYEGTSWLKFLRYYSAFPGKWRNSTSSNQSSGPCHSSGELSPISHREGPSSIPYQFM